MPAETVLPIDPCVDQLSRWSPLLRVDDVPSELLALLEQVPDPRDRRGRRYRLPSLLVLALSAVAAGARSFYAIADWVSCASAEVLARVGIRFRVPSESTIRLTLGCLDGDGLDRVLGGYLSKTRHQEGERVAVAIDGKTVRGARTADALAIHDLLGRLHGVPPGVGGASAPRPHPRRSPHRGKRQGRRISCRADPMTVSGQLSCPPPGS